MVRTMLLWIVAPAAALAGDFKGSWDGAVIMNAERIPFRMEVSESPARVCFFEDTQPVCSTTVRIAAGALTAKWDYLNSQLTISSAAGALSGTYVNLRTKREFSIRARPHQAVAEPSEKPAQFGGEWEVHLAEQPGPGDQLILWQMGTEIKGTILRIDGDEGTLVGQVDGNRFRIAHFSGDRPAMLRGTLQADGTLELETDAEKLVALRPAEARKRNLTPPLNPMIYAHAKNPQEPW